jgi:hypothetical protein
MPLVMQHADRRPPNNGRLALGTMLTDGRTPVDVSHRMIGRFLDVAHATRAGAP